MFSSNKQTLRAAAMLIGAIIGAGIFGVPYAISKVGFGVGLIYLIVLGLVTAIIHLAYGQVVLSTDGKHQLTGYAEKYIGKKGKILALLSIFFGSYGALIAYIIKVGEFLQIITQIGTSFWWSVIFFGLMAFLVLLGLRTLSRFESVLTLLLMITLIILSLVGLPSIKIDNLNYFDLSDFFLPYGIILFAMAGTSIIPEMGGLFERDKRKNLKKAILLGTSIPIFLYILFALMVVGVTGLQTSDDAIRGLEYLHPAISHLGALIGVLTMTTSFLMLAMALKDLYQYDFKVPRIPSWFLACFLPFTLFLLGFQEFIMVIGIAGTLTVGFGGIIIVLLYFECKREKDKKPDYQIRLPRWLGLFLIGAFSLGIIYEVFYLLKNWLKF